MAGDAREALDIGTPAGDYSTVAQLAVGGPAASGPLRLVTRVSVPFTPAATAAAIGYAEQTIPVAAAQVGDVVVVIPPGAPAANVAQVGARVSVAGTVALAYANLTAAANTPTAGVHVVCLFRI